MTAESKRPYVVAIGCNAVDRYYDAPSYPTAGDKALIRHTADIPGGMIPNAACILSALGAECYLLDTVGMDAHTNLLMEDLHRYGVRTEYMETIAGTENNQTFIIRAEGDRTIFVVENPEKRFVDIDETRMELLKNAAYIYTIIPDLKKLDGYEQLVKEWSKAGARLVLDAESASYADRQTDRFFFEAASIVVFNEHSYAKYCGADGEQAIRDLIGNSEKLVLLTLGAQGCRVITAWEDFALPSYPVNPVDTTGAGDCFNASFLFGIMQGWPLRRCAQLATAAAARSIELIGARSGAANLQEILKFEEKAGCLE